MEERTEDIEVLRGSKGGCVVSLYSVSLEMLAVVTAANLVESCSLYHQENKPEGAVAVLIEKTELPEDAAARAMHQQAELLYAVVKSDARGASKMYILRTLDRAKLVTEALEFYQLWEEGLIAVADDERRGVLQLGQRNWSFYSAKLLERIAEEKAA